MPNSTKMSLAGGPPKFLHAASSRFMAASSVELSCCGALSNDAPGRTRGSRDVIVTGSLRQRRSAQVSLDLPPVRSPEKTVSFGFGESTPDAVRFVKSQRVLAALLGDRALCTELLCCEFALPPIEATFTIAVEEHRGICPATAGHQLPIPGLSDSGNRWTRRTRSATLACSNLVHGQLGPSILCIDRNMEWRRRSHRRRHFAFSACSIRRSRRSSHPLRLLRACVRAFRVLGCR
jgi:hypothetical protein